MTVEHGIFVPAVLGVGLLFSLATLARDSVHRLRGQRWLGRRALVQGRVSGLLVRGGSELAAEDRSGRRPRLAYALVGPVLVLLAVYLAIGSYGNYIGWTGWVESIGWIWFAYLVCVFAFGVIGGAACALAVRWHRPPTWTLPLLARTPLGSTPPSEHGAPARSLHPHDPDETPRDRLVGVIRIDERAAATARTVAVIWSGVAVVVFSLLAVRGWLPESPDPATIEPTVSGPIQLALLALYGLGALVASRFEAIGAAVLAAAAAALAILSSIQYPTWFAVLAAFALGVPAFLHWLAWQRDRHTHHLVVLALATTCALAGVWVSAERLQAFTLGPAHPSSTLAALPPSDVDWMWAGGTTGTHTTVVARLADPHDEVRLAVSRTDDLADPTWTGPLPALAGDDDIVRFEVDGLVPDTPYFYGVEADGEIDRTRTGTFRTFPVGASSFRVAFASCARSGSNGAVFDAIRESNPLLYLNLGDLHYANITDEEIAPFLRAYRSALATTSQSALYRSTSTEYVWDDHDYGGNDANRLSSSRAAAQEAYRLAAPHYPLEGGADGGPIYQAFTIGRVRFIVTDARSERDPKGGDDPSMLGAEQLDWLQRELRDAAAAYPVVVWVNGTPWIGEASPSSDSWAGYAGERQRIGTLIGELGLSRRLVMLSGDAHMVAIDDGTNSGYGGAGFPVFQAAALDRPGGVKGGPYSEGTFPGAGQFGTLDVDDSGGDRITLTMTGRTWDGRVLVGYTMQVPVG